MSSSPLTALAEQCLAHSRALDAYNASQGLPPASFAHESFISLPLETEEQRRSLISLAQDLKRLAQGPRDALFEICNESTDLANLEYLYANDIFQHIPLGYSVSYISLASATGLDTIFLRRMLRAAMMNRIFSETDDGQVQHTALSAMLHSEPGARDSCGFLLQELFPGAARFVEATKKYPSSGEPNETGFNLAFNTNRSFYHELEQTPERSRRFGSAMRWLSQGGRFDTEHLIRGYPWSEVDLPDSIVVDVGGGHGTVGRAVAAATKELQVVVQDLPLTAAQGNDTLPLELKGRVRYMPHDFFSPQPLIGAAVYFFRHIFHNWSDKYASRILASLIPALRHGSRILLAEFLPADRSETRWSEKQPYILDMLQAIGWNSIERTPSDWERLFTSADRRLRFMGTRTPPGSSLSFIEARFEDPAAE